MYELIPTAIEIALALVAFVAAYTRLSANLERARDELKAHIAASEARFNEHMAADEARHRDHVLAAVYELQVKHLTEKLEEIAIELREVKRLILLPVQGRKA